jgi:hypothetical protein
MIDPNPNTNRKQFYQTDLSLYKWSLKLQLS